MSSSRILLMLLKTASGLCLQISTLRPFFVLKNRLVLANLKFEHKLRIFLQEILLELQTASIEYYDQQPQGRLHKKKKTKNLRHYKLQYSYGSRQFKFVLLLLMDD